MWKKFLLIAVLFMPLLLPVKISAGEPKISLGNEVLLSDYLHLVQGKKVGLVTNHTGVDSQGRSTIEILANDPDINLVALYGPEHGIDGVARAGAYVESYIHEQLGIPVYSLYGVTRMPTEDMLRDVDLLLFDIQDIGARTYTYISTLNYCMIAAEKYNKPILVLDRPNPVGGLIVEGPVLEDPYKSFVGIDNLPMAHGMTVGELAQFFNRKINADLTVIAMQGYTRDMIFQDTGLPWVQTSPNIPDSVSAFGYMATGLGEGTGIYQADKFKWIGGRGIDSVKYAQLLNQSGLPGVTFLPETRGEAGGVRLNITDYHTFNPARSGIYALAYAYSLGNFTVPKSGQTVVMFDKIMGTNKIGHYLEQRLTPQQIEANYAASLNLFREEREKYLIYGIGPSNQMEAAQALFDLNIIEGYPDGTLGLKRMITRAEFAKVAIAASGLINEEPNWRHQPSGFTDVNEGGWYTGWINLAASMQYFIGYPEGTFRPDEPITAAEVLTVLLRLTGYDDRLPGDWPADYLDRADDLGITEGLDLQGGAAIERGKVFLMANRILRETLVEFDPEENSFVRKEGEPNLLDNFQSD